MKKTKICEGINLYLLPYDKFKNFILGAFINTGLTKETAALNGVLPRVLSSKTANYKSKKEINLKLDDMYGARLFSNVTKRGEAHIINVGIDAVAGRFTDDDIESEAAKMLDEVLTNTFCVNDGFDSAVLNREQDVVKKAIESVINDKRQYAVHRCVEEMCKDEIYGISRLGTTSDVENI